MCVVSMIGDHYTQRFNQVPNNLQPIGSIPWQQQASKFEFDQLKREVEEMKALLQKAKAYDEQTGQKECEQEEKLAKLREIAKLVGIDLDDVIGKAKA